MADVFDLEDIHPNDGQNAQESSDNDDAIEIDDVSCNFCVCKNMAFSRHNHI